MHAHDSLTGFAGTILLLSSPDTTGNKESPKGESPALPQIELVQTSSPISTRKCNETRVAPGWVRRGGKRL